MDSRCLFVFDDNEISGLQSAPDYSRAITFIINGWLGTNIEFQCPFDIANVVWKLTFVSVAAKFFSNQLVPNTAQIGFKNNLNSQAYIVH